MDKVNGCCHGSHISERNFRQIVRYFTMDLVLCLNNIMTNQRNYGIMGLSLSKEVIHETRTAANSHSPYRGGTAAIGRYWLALDYYPMVWSFEHRSY
jgi:hypothetical protein